ncbi:glycosyltransferase family 9 protein [Edaphobacter sp.]|uniref:glycosyltransferase family 9 protein n=1 Tax=Edaphobacter sp. TaxID=1934404 RepID=UPI002DBAB19A|nr:glycosyltransferase family 9 protein [Edaphobacter sp.]HEU5341111.1 glycosyltransferase family 9 protein [Edaphobacter sp.]
MPTDIKRVLIYRLGSLGDTVVALPALHLIARAFPQADRRLLTNFPVNSKAAPAATILENTGLVHGYFHYAVNTRNPLALLSLWWQLIRWRPQVLVYLAAKRGIGAARRDAAFFRICGVPRIIGVPLTEDMQQNRPEPNQSFEPEASRLVRNIAELGEADLDDPEGWNLHLTHEELAKAAEALRPASGRPILAVSVGTKRQSKDWGRENWRALLDVLVTQYPHHELVLLGSADEAAASEYAAAPWRERSPVINLCGQLTPRESAAVLTHACIFLGHDSGPMHLAAAVGTPCVAIFSARNKPRVWFPYGKQHRVIYHRVECWGCNLETCIIEKKKCLTSITVPEVLEQVRALLG